LNLIGKRERKAGQKVKALFAIWLKTNARRRKKTSIEKCSQTSGYKSEIESSNDCVKSARESSKLNLRTPDGGRCKNQTTVDGKALLRRDRLCE